MIESLERDLLEVWDEVAPERARPRRLHVAKLSHEDYPPPAAPLLLLLFADRDARPTAVAKLARGPEGDALVEREAGALRSAREMLPPELRDCIPRPLRARPVNGRACLLTTALPGEVELHHTWGARRARARSARMSAALEWCRRAAEATRAGTMRAGEWLGGSPRDAVARLERSGCAPPVLARLESCLAAGWDEAWPCGLVHGDFFPGNLLFGRTDAGSDAWPHVSVVDWMFAETRAPLLCDPVTYELSFSAQVLHRGGRMTADEIRAVHELPAFAACRRGWMERGVNLGLGRWARVATLVHAALRDLDPACGRRPIGSAWVRLLEVELEAFS